jgi:hypothetical protein
MLYKSFDKRQKLRLQQCSFCKAHEAEQYMKSRQYWIFPDQQQLWSDDDILKVSTDQYCIMCVCVCVCVCMCVCFSFFLGSQQKMISQILRSDIVLLHLWDPLQQQQQQQKIIQICIISLRINLNVLLRRPLYRSSAAKLINYNYGWPQKSNNKRIKYRETREREREREREIDQILNGSVGMKFSDLVYKSAGFFGSDHNLAQYLDLVFSSSSTFCFFCFLFFWGLGVRGRGGLMSVRLLMISGDHIMMIWFFRKLYGQSKMFTCDRVDQMMIMSRCSRWWSY